MCICSVLYVHNMYVFQVLQAPCKEEVESLSGYESYAGYESCDVEEEERGEEGERGEEEAEGAEETEGEEDSMAVWSKKKN